MPQQIPRVAQDFQAGWNSHDWNKFAPLFTDDCVYEDLALGRVCHGKEEAKAFFDETLVFSADFKIELKSAFVAGDWMGSEWIMSGTHTGDVPAMKATGKKFSIRGASILELRKGKISRNTDYWNMASFLQQVGLMPAAPTK